MSVTHSVSSAADALHEVGGCRGVVWQLRAGARWSLPAVEYATSDARREGITVVLADQGLNICRNVVAGGAGGFRRAVGVDLLLLGECRPTQGRIGQWAMMISAAGRRTLGIQVSQLKAVLEWLRQNHPADPIGVVAVGRMAGLAALTSAALYPGCCESVRVVGLEPSLKELANVPVTYDEAPSLFCFGLLEVADVADLIALAAPCRVEMVEPATGPAAP